MAADWDNLSDVVFDHALRQPDAPALIAGDERVSYGELARLIAGATVYLRQLGVAEGQAVGVFMGGTIDHVVLSLALTRIGAIAFDLPPRLHPEDDAIRRWGLAPVFAAPDARLPRGARPDHIVGVGWRRTIAGLPGDCRSRRDPREVLCVSLSSGSTGLPIAVPSNQREWRARIDSAVQLFHPIFTLRRPPVFLMLGGMSFSGFFLLMACQLRIGGPVVLLADTRDPHELARAIAGWADAFLLTVPAFCHDLVALAPPSAPLFPAMRALIVGGAPLAAEDKPVFLERLTPNLYEGYGNSAVGAIAGAFPADMQLRPEATGRVAPGVDLEVVDALGRRVPQRETGHIRIRGPGVARSYYRPPDPQRRLEGFHGGWFYPADLGSLDADGYLSIRGRLTDVIARSGVEIFPGDIEAALRAHPAIGEAAVVGTGPPEAQRVVAFVTLRTDGSRSELAKFVAAALPRERAPDDVLFVQSLPRTHTGKIDRAALRTFAATSTAGP